LDNWKQLVASQDYELARFEALDVPSAVMSRGRETAAAWDRITRKLRRFVQRLEGTTNRRELIAAVATLPAIRSDIAADEVTRAAGLIRLGGRRCTLNAPIVTPTITLPGTSEPVPAKASTLPFTGTLPATGLNAWWLLLAGAIMTIAGTILRRVGLRSGRARISS
jgi:LPXTG-motif cell wall-anchored protein